MNVRKSGWGDLPVLKEKIADKEMGGAKRRSRRHLFNIRKEMPPGNSQTKNDGMRILELLESDEQEDFVLIPHSPSENREKMSVRGK